VTTWKQRLANLPSQESQDSREGDKSSKGIYTPVKQAL